MPTRELRVHGVSGTLPRNMLYTDPVTTDPASEHTKIFRRRPTDATTDTAGVEHQFEAEAFHWGGLTTGHWLTAFWILLGPFAFANVAGWMASKRGVPARATVRVSGLLLTAFFVIQIGYVFIEALPAMAPAAWRDTAVRGSFLLYLALFVFGFFMWLSTQSHFHGFGWQNRLRLTLGIRRSDLLPPTLWEEPDLAERTGQWADPANAPITSPILWSEHALLHRIRRLHLTISVGVMTALMASGLDLLWLRWVAIGTVLLALILTIVTTTSPKVRLVQQLTAWAPALALAGWLAGYSQILSMATPASPWPGIHEITFIGAGVLGASGLAALTAGWVSLGALVIGTLYGASLGTGIGLVAENRAGIDQLTAHGAGWVAVALLFLVEVIAITALALGFGGGPLPHPGGLMALLRRVTGRGRALLTVVAAYGLIAGAVAAFAACSDGCSQTFLAPPARGSIGDALFVGLTAMIVVLGAARLWSIRRMLAVGLGVVGGVFLWLFVTARLPVVPIAGTDLDLNNLVDIAKVLIVTLPVLVIIRSVIGSVRAGVSSRHVGIMWDVASMWPRWFHPLAPPGYGPKVVKSLGEHLATTKPDLLEAHSQGSVIAAITIDQAKPEDLAGMKLITFGNPLGHLYEPMFPDVGIRDLITRVEDRVAWLNLWRDTDPIGGSPIGTDGDVLVVDGVGHSDYEVTSAFREARHNLV